MIRCLESRVLAVFVLAIGTLSLASASASGAIVHKYVREIGESAIPTPPGPLAKPFLPFGVAVDNSTGTAAGDVYVTDYENAAVYRFSAMGSFETQLTGFTVPWPAAVDNSNSLVAEGGLYVGDDSTGDVYRGKSVFASGLGGVTGIAVDQATGEVYVVAEGEPHVVHRFSSSGSALAPLEGIGHATTVAIDNGCYYKSLSGTACTTAHPSDGDVYVIDNEAGMVDKFDSTGKLILQWPANGYGLAVDQTNGHIYVAGGGKVEEFAEDGTRLSEITGASPDYPSRENEFAPLGIAVDLATDDVYVADPNNRVVDVFGPDVETSEAFTGSVDNLQATSATLLGEVNPKGEDSTSFFEFGPCAAPTCSASEPYATKITPVPADVGNGNTNVAVEAELANLAPNQSYHYQLFAENESGKSVSGGEREFTTPAVPPQVETGLPTFVGFDRASLKGAIDPEHSEAAYYFEYSQCETTVECATTSYSNKSPEQKSANFGVINAFYEMVPLQPQSKYHYRLVAESAAAGRVDGDNVEFDTSTPPGLEVSNGTPTGIGQTTATISATINTNGVPSNYIFQLGTQAGVYEAEVGAGKLGADIFEANTITLTLQNLTPGVTYHYRVLVSNAYDAEVFSADATFTTAPVALLVAEPITPPLLVTPLFAFPAEQGKVIGELAKCKRGYRLSKQKKCVKAKNRKAKTTSATSKCKRDYKRNNRGVCAKTKPKRKATRRGEEAHRKRR